MESCGATSKDKVDADQVLQKVLLHLNGDPSATKEFLAVVQSRSASIMLSSGLELYEEVATFIMTLAPLFEADMTLLDEVVAFLPIPLPEPKTGLYEPRSRTAEGWLRMYARMKAGSSCA